MLRKLTLALLAALALSAALAPITIGMASASATSARPMLAPLISGPAILIMAAMWCVAYAPLTAIVCAPSTFAYIIDRTSVRSFLKAPVAYQRPGFSLSGVVTREALGRWLRIIAPQLSIHH
jgi:hypothetical protein